MQLSISHAVLTMCIGNAACGEPVSPAHDVVVASDCDPDDTWQSAQFHFADTDFELECEGNLFSGTCTGDSIKATHRSGSDLFDTVTLTGSQALGRRYYTIVFSQGAVALGDNALGEGQLTSTAPYTEYCVVDLGSEEQPSQLGKEVPCMTTVPLEGDASLDCHATLNIVP